MNKPFKAANELEARLLLHATPRLGPQAWQRLLEYFGSAQAAFHASALSWQQLGMPEASISGRYDSMTHSQAMQALRWLEGVDQHVLYLDDADYPALLAETAGAPPLLFVEGNPLLLQQPQLAIIGSRHASPTGVQLAHAFAATLAGSGCAITSGLAAGMDSAAHEGALDAGGLTIAVMGTGMLHTYPRRNQRLRQRLREAGGLLVSELPISSGPHASHFPRRNRIISGLSLGVLVVEAGIESGSLITARYAAEQGRDVFAIPGSIHYPGSKGCHQLIREGATLVESVQDILEQWRHWQRLVPEGVAGSELEEHPLLALLQARPMDSESLALQLEMDMAEVLTELTNLEIDGRIRQQAGQWFFVA